MSTSELSIASMHRLCKKAGAKRVSEKATKELAAKLENAALKIAKDALFFSKCSGRKTLRAEDIRISVNKLFYK
jgi:histone H3/H4